MDSTEVKQESVDLAESNPDNVEVSSEAHTYILQQQQLPYSNSSREVIPSESNNETEEPASKRPRRASAMRALEHMDSEDDDLDDGDDFAKAESDASDKEEDEEEESFQGPSTSLDDQPGPSGMGKGSSEASSSIWKTDICEVQIDIKNEEVNIEDFINVGKTAVLNSCLHCSRVYKNRSSLMKHMISHSEDRPYICQICDRKFKRKIGLQEHMYSHESPEILRCGICNKLLSTKKSLKYHIKSHSRDPIEITCRVCNASFKSKKGYEIHMETKHNNNPMPKLFICDVCSYACSSKHTLNNHRLMHEEGYKTNAKYKCDHCEKSFTRKKYLDLHCSRIHDTDKKVYMCEYCGKEMSTSVGLKEHLLLHQGIRPVECPTCKKMFTLKRTLKTHLLTHTGEKPYKCEKCGKSFTQHSSYKIHLRYHTGERPYQCKFCDKGFVCRSAMNTHITAKHKLEK